MMKRVVRKTKTHRYPKRSPLKKFPLNGLVIGMFLAGIIIGGGGFALFHRDTSKPVIKEVYYTRDAFSLPKDIKSGFVLGDASQKYHIPILLYHYVEFNKDPHDTIRMSLTIRRDIFERQVQDLLKHGYTFLTVSDVGEIIDHKLNMPKKAVVLSFDDGYRDFYTDIFPILQFYRAKATFFIVSDFLNHSNNVTDAQLLEIVKSNLVEIGGHTVNHASLPSLTKELAWKEIDEDKKYLEEKFGIKMVSFAYPYGQFNQEDIDLVKKAGYLQAVSVVRGEEQSSENRFFMYRIRPGNATGASLDNLLSGK